MSLTCQIMSAGVLVVVVFWLVIIITFVAYVLGKFEPPEVDRSATDYDIDLMADRRCLEARRRKQKSGWGVLKFILGVGTAIILVPIILVKWLHLLEWLGLYF